MDDTWSGRRERALAQRARAQQIRLKDLHAAEKRFLDLKLIKLAWDRNRTESVMERDIRMLKTELASNSRINDDDDDDCDDDVNDTVSITDMQSEAPRRSSSAISRAKQKQRIYSAPTISHRDRDIQPRIGISNIKWRTSKTRLSLDIPKCTFDKTQLHCPYFPCCKPQMYHHIGFDIKTDKCLRDRCITSTQSPAIVSEVFLEELEAKSVRRARRSCADQCHIKERALKKIIADMKTRSEANRPRDWCTNYGIPTSRRKILKAARPTSMEDFKGIL
jgi:hypothetical protein